MSENQGSRAERIARYKEERRKQLAAQYSNRDSSLVSEPQRKLSSSSGSEGPRTTRTSRLRAAAAAAASASVQDVQRKEKNPISSVVSNLVSPVGIERDKSSKRKSNLNRSLTSEEVPPADIADDVKSRRRRRRFFPPEVLQHSVYSSSNEDKAKSDTHTAYISPLSSPITASTTRYITRRSNLSIHMENARKSVTPPCSETGKYSRSNAANLNPIKDRLPKHISSDADCTYNNLDAEINGNTIFSNKENIKRHVDMPVCKSVNNSKKVPALSSDDKYKSINISKRMDELTALTRDTLVRVETLANKNRAVNKKGLDRKYPTPRAQLSNSKDTRSPTVSEPIRPHTASILKKKSAEDVSHEQTSISLGSPPVSILKRKVSQEDNKTGSVSLPTHTSPVTFSPNVIEPSSNRKKQGILKKRRSLDESQVLRHRSCSPDVANNKPDSRSILKNQRRSSLEEITRTHSPDSHLQGILKRKPFKIEDDPDNPLNSPQSILKRRSGASSAGSTSGTQHVSIATAVILAAAGGAEMILDSNEHVKPILKKKHSEDYSNSENSHSEGLKPILKKKSSTDTDDSEERPKKPILKSSRNSLDNKESFEFDSARYRHSISSACESNSECEVKPILKQTEEYSRGVKLSFYASENKYVDTITRHSKNRKSDVELNNGCTDFEREFRRPRPLSVSDLVINFEETLTSTGAVPKKTGFKRYSDRYRTQPVTFNEIEASLNFVQSPQLEDSGKTSAATTGRTIESGNVQSLLNLSSSLKNETLLNNLLSNTTSKACVSGVSKMSSDSAFQSLGDGLELEDEKSPTGSDNPLVENLESSKLQLKAIAEEAKKLRLLKNKDYESPTNLSLSEKIKKFNTPTVEKTLLKRDVSKRRRTQFQTQPVTFEEVQTALSTPKITITQSDTEKDVDTASNMSLSEKIKMFSTSTTESDLLKRDVPRRRRAQFQTQPITPAEVETARSTEGFLKTRIKTTSDDDKKITAKTERKGILKSKIGYSKSFKEVSSSQPRSVLKKVESNRSTEELYSPKSILKPETVDFANDEGISSDDYASDSDVRRGKSVSVSEKENVLGRSAGGKYNIGARLANINVDKLPGGSVKSCSDSHTSDDSSGGREIQSIIGREAAAAVKARNKYLSEGLSKSKSSSKVENDFQYQATGVQRSMTQAAMPRTIGQLQAKLQQSGDTDWRKRIAKLNNSGEELTLLKAKNLYNEELSEKSSILAAKIDELDASTQKWKNRVEKSDAVNFSVAGRMQEEDKINVSLNLLSADKNRTPKAKRFKGKDEENNGKELTRISPEPAGNLGFKRSISVPGSGTNNDSSETESSLRSSGRRVKILKPDDDNFKSFFRPAADGSKSEESLDLSVEDFDGITRETLLVQKRTTKVQKRRAASKNPVKALASRPDIADEYEEFITGVADKEMKRLNVEKLAKSSSFALEALAGLASKEDFSSILLKKCASPRSSLLPYKDLMLIHIKGRRHVQARLVEPVAASINDGDNYILITPDALYNFVGPYSNVIEQTRACDIINYIQQTGDMGCKADKVVTISSKKCTSPGEVEKFWKILGSSSSDVSVSEAGHVDEDEVYETSIVSTNMIYSLENCELVPVEEYWGKIPKIRMLSPSKVYVFDFGTEMYVWSGVTAPTEEKKTALKLAKDLWSEGYNYSDCSINPINIAGMLGAHKKQTSLLKSDIRPEWALFAKVTQHTETILFREKFLDWPNYSRIIKSKEVAGNNKSESSVNVSSCDAAEMRQYKYSEPDFEIDGSHLGRGHRYYDEDINRLYEITTLDVTSWHILENTFETMPNNSVGHFYEGDTYVIRWQYRVTISGRRLTGKPSSHNKTGRDRCLYFCWLGNKASVNEKGTAALLTVELDSENARQVRVTQGLEPTAFLRLFDGKMTVHNGKQDKDSDNADRLYIVKGEVDGETVLIQVPCSMRSLRSRGAFLFIQPESDTVIIWNGSKSTEQTRSVAKKLADHVASTKSTHFGLSDSDDVTVIVNDEGQEDAQFLKALGEKKQLYFSLIDQTTLVYDFTPRLFHFSSVSGTFKATEVLCSYRSQFVTPYPFLQSEIYSANQPALFLFDNNHEIWLWQGWWPEREDDTDLSEQVGSAVIRWQAERKAAMLTAVDYWKHKNSDSKPIPANLVWAGLEPLEFSNLFPIWEDRDDVAELNIKEGRKAGEIISVEEELAQLTRTTYPLSQLLQRPLPEGVDPTQLEIYLSPEEFSELLSMTKSDFQKLPAWKQTAIKKEKGLF